MKFHNVLCNICNTDMKVFYAKCSMLSRANVYSRYIVKKVWRGCKWMGIPDDWWREISSYSYIMFALLCQLRIFRTPGSFLDKTRGIYMLVILDNGRCGSWINPREIYWLSINIIIHYTRSCYYEHIKWNIDGDLFYLLNIVIILFSILSETLYLYPYLFKNARSISGYTINNERNIEN